MSSPDSSVGVDGSSSRDTETAGQESTSKRSKGFYVLGGSAVLVLVVVLAIAGSASNSKSASTTTSPAQGASTYRAFLNTFTPLVAQYIADDKACAADLNAGIWDSFYNHCSNVTGDGSSIKYAYLSSGNVALDNAVSAFGNDVTTVGTDVSALTSSPTSSDIATIKADNLKVDADIAKVEALEKSIGVRYGTTWTPGNPTTIATGPDSAWRTWQHRVSSNAGALTRLQALSSLPLNQSPFYFTVAYLNKVLTATQQLANSGCPRPSVESRLRSLVTKVAGARLVLLNNEKTYADAQNVLMSAGSDAWSLVGGHVG